MQKERIELDYSVWRKKTVEEKVTIFNSLTKKEIKLLRKHPRLFLFEKQIPPDDPWRYFLFQAGRGSGKSHAGTAWLYEKYLLGAKSMAILGATIGDLWKDIIPQLLNWFGKEDQPEKTDKVFNYLQFRNGCKIYLYSSESDTRGPNLEYLVCEEIPKWCAGNQEMALHRFNVASYAVRIGKNPQIFIASTPVNSEFFRQFDRHIKQGNKYYARNTADFRQNPFLSQSYKDSLIEEFGHTKLGRQELYGELVDEINGALWSYDLIDATRIKLIDLPKLIRIVIGIDPAVTMNKKSDETGIIVAGIDSNAHIYILHDASGKYSPEQWATKAVSLFNSYHADRIVCETNQGGDLVESTLRAVDSTLPIRKIHATKGKILRAEPVSAMWETKKAHIVDSLPELERQMTSFSAFYSGSPDRLDAMVYAATDLQQKSGIAYRDFANFPGF